MFIVPSLASLLGRSRRPRSLGIGPTYGVALAVVGAISGVAALASLAAAQQTAVPRDLDAYVSHALEEFHTPGLAIAIVKDGRIVLAKGFGVRRLGDPTPVDANTLFQIASNTKAFTAAALAILVDEGKLRWDDRVTQFIPGFQLSDPYVTSAFTVRDMLTHRSGLGLGAGDLLWFHSNYPREEIIRRMRAAKFVTGFRAAYAYDNVMYIAAGQVIAAASGQSWETFIRQRLLDPLGMATAATSLLSMPAGADAATPHDWEDGHTAVTAADSVDAIAPAGGINAGVADLAKWMIVQLDSGRLPRGRLWSSARTQEMWAPQTIMPIDKPPASLAALSPNFDAYGFGWELRDYRGRKIVTHSGGLAGMTSNTELVPSEKLGVVVLTNMDSSLSEALCHWVVDAYLGAPRTDWGHLFAERERQADSAGRAAEQRQRSARAADSHPSLPLAKYAGPYTDALYGDATIVQENSRLVLRFSHSPAFTGDLEHWQYDTFVAHWRTRHLEDAFVTFALTPSGAIDHFTMAAVSPLADFSFDFQDLWFAPAVATTAGSPAATSAP